MCQLQKRATVRLRATFAATRSLARLDSKRLTSYTIRMIGNSAALRTLIAVTAYVSALIIAFAVRSRFKPSALREILLYSISAIGLLLAASYSTAEGPNSVIQRVFGYPMAAVFIGAACALALYSLRRWHKTSYGLIEIILGLATLMSLGWKPPGSDPVAVAVAFAGAVYVIVRGLTNVSEARPKG